ncbi:NAD+ kinase [Paenibacillus cellulosilyticus]|uniref:NAD kinase n=1 Tax=Paenibacillus cellulosilyticus TaxID=375489 RepID=A0A2V2YVR1_9BACL|nr:NAD kinase [Paenibacillus cellulosilyticus]PWW02550.1 NAD+ kinase [Paenibacillus cellulosilyticus]QKS47245.1 NAD kinase [Paenibacillus cellulosilyticus]
MNYTVLDRGDELSRSLAAKFHELAAKRGMVRNDDSPSVIISIGGDGTLLQAFHTYAHRADLVSFVGVHTGHLGFYADWKADELEELVQVMSEKEPRIVSYPLAQIEVETSEGTSSYIALNEFTLKGVDGTLVAQININDESFEMFRGDGIVISTPSGSTAYNKSLGGAIVHPSIESLQIAEIASINNRVYRTLGSSVLLPKHHHCDILSSKKQRIMLAIDHITILRDDIRSIRCAVANRKVSFARYRPFTFWNRVREAFIGYDVQ